jgi:hypothetical protein
MFAAPPGIRSMRRQIVAFAESLLLHLLGLALVVFSAPLTRLSLHAGGARQRPPLEVFVLAAPEPAGSAGLQPMPAEAEPFLPVIDPPSDLSIARLSFNLRKISAHATLLFPFVTPGLALERLLVTRSRSQTFASALRSLGGPRDVPDEDGALVLDAASRQALVDRAWSRRDRWDAFQPIAAAAARYDANRGDLAEIIKMYREQNGLQPYVDRGVKDHSFWVYLGLAADHVEFVDFISRYVRDHPGTRASTELLFLLDTIALGSVEDLLALVTVNPQADLQATQRADVRAYAFVVKVQEHYKEALSNKGLTSELAIRAYYDRIRLALLDILLRTTPNGYRASDARFLIGEIYWRQGNRDDAIRAWRELNPDAADTYVMVSKRIAEVLERTAATVADRDIDDALAAERSRWRASSYDRLKRFGYRSDSY